MPPKEKSLKPVKPISHGMRLRRWQTRDAAPISPADGPQRTRPPWGMVSLRMARRAHISNTYRVRGTMARAANSLRASAIQAE